MAAVFYLFVILCGFAFGWISYGAYAKQRWGRRSSKKRKE